MRQRRRVELLNDYECEIKYHLGKANVVADALIQKEYSNRRVKTLSINIQSHLFSQIKETQFDSMKTENNTSEALRGMEKNFEIKEDGTYYIMNRIWVPKLGGFREVVMNEAHKTLYSIHLGSDQCTWISSNIIGGLT